MSKQFFDTISNVKTTFRVRHSRVRVQGQATEKRKAGQQRPPATENARPNTRTNAGHEKRRHDATKHPRPAEEAEASTTTHPTAAGPTTTTGKAHAKRGSGPSNYTQALYRNARCTQGGPRAQKGASLAIREPCTKTAMQTYAAHMKAGRPKRCQAAEKVRIAPKNANP